MMHYRKGENIEQEVTKDDLPFDDCLSKLPQNEFLWMHVKGGTKVHNVINYAKNALDKSEYRTIIWSGSGGGVVKTVSCAEIIKRSYPLYQLTRMDQITIEEHWEPQMDGLEPLVAKRKVPSLHILMTLDPIDESITDVQKPNTTTEYWRGELSEDTQQRKQTRRTASNIGGQSQQRQRHQKPKQSHQQTASEQEGEEAHTSEQNQRRQKPKNPNWNRGEQRRKQGGNENRNSNRDQQQQQDQQDQLQETPQQQQATYVEDQQKPQQSQRYLRPKPKQQRQSPLQAKQAEGASTTSNTNASKTVEEMEC